MLKRNMFFLLLVVILVGSAVLAGCAKTTPATTTAPVTTTSPATTAPKPTTATAPVTTTPAPTSAVQKGGILTIINPNTPSAFGYPVQAAGFAPYFANMPSLESFWVGAAQGVFKPALATSWDVAADKSSITLHLRKGVTFHDGTVFDAKAAKWNLDLFLKRGTGGPADWKSIDIVDDYTIRINLKVFKNTQIGPSYWMISPTAVEKNGIPWANTHPVGTGPFSLKNFVPDTSLEYARYDGYWDTKANVDGIKYFYIVDATTAAMAMQAGDALVWEGADARSTTELVKKGFKVETRRGAMMNLIPDSAHPDSPLSNLKVRQAVEYAINRPAIVDALGYGFWEAVVQPNAPEQTGHINGLVGRPYNPDKAKQLLTEAGFPNGFSTTIITSSSLNKDPLVAIQADLAKVGIKVTIDVQSPAKWAATRTTGWSNGFFYTTHGATDTNYGAYLERYYTPTSAFAYPVLALPTGWVDLINQILTTSDAKEMITLQQKAVQWHVDECLEIPLWIQSETYTIYPTVQNMGVGVYSASFQWDVAGVWIKKEK